MKETMMETKSNSERLMIVRLGIHQWYPRKFDRKATQQIADLHGVSIERAGRFNKILVDLETIKPLQKRLRQLREDHYAMTCPWGDDGQRVLPAELYFDYVAMVRDSIVEIDRLADTYAEQYQVELDKARVELNGLFNEDDYPDPQQLRLRFGVDYRFEPLPEGDSVLAWTVIDDKAREDIKRELQESLERSVQEAQAHVVNNVVERANEFIGKVRRYDAQIQETDKGRLYDSAVDNLRDVVKLVLSGLNVTGDQELAKLAADLDDALTGVTADRIRNGQQFRTEKTEAVENVLDKFQGVYG
jgi:hypothetical protein